MKDKHRHIQYNIRLPQQLLSRLKKSALANNISLTAEIVSRLSKSFANHIESKEDETKTPQNP